MRLLRTLLTPEQLRQLRTRKYFLVTGSEGGTYRIDPRRGWTERVTRHGRHWFRLLVFCLHDDRTDPSEAMPPGDLAIGHMLLLLADERQFLGLANATFVRDQFWNRQYLRGLRDRVPRIPIVRNAP